MPTSDLAERYDVDQTANYIIEGGFRSVALQFPDDQLSDSPAVSQLLQQKLGNKARVFILADTAYNPLGVDEVAAQHLGAQCVVHYGRASLGPVTSLPAFFVFPKDQLDVPSTAAAVQQAVGEAVRSRLTETAAAATAPFSAVVVLLDQGYQHRHEDLRRAIQGGQNGGAAGDGGVGPDSGMLQAASSAQPRWVFAKVAARSIRPQQPQPSAASQPLPPAASSSSSSFRAPGSATTILPSLGGCCTAAAFTSAPVTAPTSAAAPTTTTSAAAVAAGVAAAASGSCDPASLAGPQAATGRRPGSARTPEEEERACGGACAEGLCRLDVIGDGGFAGTAAVEQSATAVTAVAPSAEGSLMGQPLPGTAHAEEEGQAAADAACACSMTGLCWSLPPAVRRSGCLYVWIGPYGSSAHQVLQLTHSTCEWLSYDPSEGGSVRQGLSEDTRRLLKRRNFLVEKTRRANIIGLLVGTLGSAGFRDVISALRRLAVGAGKKTYTFLMGKPNPAKLGNFPEVDVFVMVCDAEGLILDCREYLSPLVTPWEAATALLDRHLDPEDYRMEMRDVLELEAQNRQTQQQQRDEEREVDAMALQALGSLGLSVATRGTGGSAGREVVARSAAEFLALKRSFKGLEMPATGAAPKAAELAMEGLSGRAAVYSAEGESQS